MYAQALFLTGASLLLSPVLAWDSTPFSPPSVPLAVRTPYLSVWLPQGAGTALNDAWATFWNGDVAAWTGYVKVDGIPYVWLGAPNVPGAQKATQKSLEWTSTQSIFTLQAGTVDLTATFLSPIEPSDLVNQSLPLSYLAVSVASNDGKPHSVQVYTDITGEWITGVDTWTANWTTTTTGGVLTHQVQLANQARYEEVNDHVQYGAAYHATINTSGVTWQTGQDSVVRGQFIQNTNLANTADTNYRAVSYSWPVFAFVHNLGEVTTSTEPLVYVVGHVRDPAIQYITANNGRQDRSVLFWTRWRTAASAISAFIKDYPNALARANAFDAQVKADALKISSDYADIVALSIRQALGSIEITVSKDRFGRWNTSDITTFMKEISSDGNVNTVDVIYPAWPVFLYTNPALGKQLLLPLFEYQATGQYPNKWAVHDMGSSYPKAVGHNDGQDEAMQVEESGNMLIMALSHAQRSGDNSLLHKYYGLLDQWTQYLIQDSLVPAEQLSTDDFAGRLANQTNLAIKGIVGIAAMSKIADIVGDRAKAKNYSSIAASYVQQWQGYALSSDKTHLTLAYGEDSSWGLAYNLLADKLLGTNVFPQEIFDLQTQWYSSQAHDYGVPLDTRHTYTKSDWEIWTAGLVTSTEVRDLLISSVRKYAADGKNSHPLGDWYETADGSAEGFRARPVVGGHLALLVVPNHS
ncbi:hypothetical protein DICSQDRAFT_155261 [Dichomitus squalens LYAD-421 SS1]|uniref:DUF1793-domain-containing protein n=1 Tax=Dichomitus squalens (strain LYAD-421) TaxID=732165 RepID=R7SYF3_DICSQ|nr:uncharacterized protein DICSQDRAFT_155261 [Dichomitus squalens LYAD-421 SS1]EJF61169.1 hypothetical protein DICSQDRAFT_155261 [Dichomitus squalens LYAD-421 SS1]